MGPPDLADLAMPMDIFQWCTRADPGNAVVFIHTAIGKLVVWGGWEAPSSPLWICPRTDSYGRHACPMHTAVVLKSEGTYTAYM